MEMNSETETKKNGPMNRLHETEIHRITQKLSINTNENTHCVIVLSPDENLIDKTPVLINN